MILLNNDYTKLGRKSIIVKKSTFSCLCLRYTESTGFSRSRNTNTVIITGLKQAYFSIKGISYI